MMSLAELRKWAEGEEGLVGHRFFRTSGSSGEEKWIALSEEALAWSARSVIEALGIDEGDVLGLALPEIHVGGYGVVVRARLAGARLARFEERWDATAFKNWGEELGVTVLSLVPTQVHDLVRAGLRGWAGLRVIVVGGGALDAELAERARGWGWPVVPSYGMTETSSQVATGEGLPLLPGWEARVVDGCLALRGGGLLTAVIRRERGEFYAVDPRVEGWFLTQDRVVIEGGGLRVLGRADRLVKVMGELVDLESLEGFWREKLGGEVALVTRCDERRGVTLLLFYEGDFEDAGGIEALNAGLPGPERVAAWEKLAELPRSPLGKVDRVALSQLSFD